MKLFPLRNLYLNVLLSVPLFCLSLLTYYLTLLFFSFHICCYDLLTCWNYRLIFCIIWLYLTCAVQCIPVCSVSYCYNEWIKKKTLALSSVLCSAVIVPHVTWLSSCGECPGFSFLLWLSKLRHWLLWMVSSFRWDGAEHCMVALATSG